MQTEKPLEAVKLNATILGQATGLESGLVSCPLKRDKAQTGSPQDQASKYLDGMNIFKELHLLCLVK